MNIKQPYQISSDYFKLLLDAGWFPERESLVSFPHHIEILPEVVKSFLKKFGIYLLVEIITSLVEMKTISSETILLHLGKLRKN